MERRNMQQTLFSYELSDWGIEFYVAILTEHIWNIYSQNKPAAFKCFTDEFQARKLDPQERLTRTLKRV